MQLNMRKYVGSKKNSYHQDETHPWKNPSYNQMPEWTLWKLPHCCASEQQFFAPRAGDTSHSCLILGGAEYSSPKQLRVSNRPIALFARAASFAYRSADLCLLRSH